MTSLADRSPRRTPLAGPAASLAALLACATVLVAGALVTPGAPGSSTGSPTHLVAASASATTPIEDLPAYDPQSTCSPRAKAGTRRVAAWLQRAYPGSGFSGISRRCSSGGTSEHKEGRAFDWRLSVRKARDRRYAAHFLARVQRADAEGNVGALGRRMGIMYLIWDDRIYSAWTGYEPRPYRHSACRRVRRCSATLRHRDHLHLSLSRRGGRGLTSWFTGVVAPPPTTPTPPPTTPTTTAPRTAVAPSPATAQAGRAG